MEIEHSQSTHQSYAMVCLTMSEMLEHCPYSKKSLTHRLLAGHNQL